MASVIEIVNTIKEVNVQEIVATCKNQWSRACDVKSDYDIDGDTIVYYDGVKPVWRIFRQIMRDSYGITYTQKQSFDVWFAIKQSIQE